MLHSTIGHAGQAERRVMFKVPKKSKLRQSFQVGPAKVWVA
jgi:hypothetical protein